MCWWPLQVIRKHNTRDGFPTTLRMGESTVQNRLARLQKNALWSLAGNRTPLTTGALSWFCRLSARRRCAKLQHRHTTPYPAKQEMGQRPPTACRAHKRWPSDTAEPSVQASPAPLPSQTPKTKRPPPNTTTHKRRKWVVKVRQRAGGHGRQGSETDEQGGVLPNRSAEVGVTQTSSGREVTQSFSEGGVTQSFSGNAERLGNTPSAERLGNLPSAERLGNADLR